MENPIFIFGAHKSGSSLLRSLLDGHPILFSVPMELHIFRAAGYWVDYRLTEKRPSDLLLSEVAQAYLSIVEQYNARHKPMSDANLVGKFDMDAVKEHLLSPKHTFSELVEGYVQGIYAGLYGMEMPRDLRIVEKSVEHAEFALDLKALYPDAKFLHIVRNPYAHLVSLRLMQAQNSGRRFPFLGKLIESLNNSYYHLYQNKRLIADYFVVRYEDLLIQPIEIMRQVADFLGIHFEDSLTRPTSLGQRWQGNSSRGEQFVGISTENVNKWHKQITNLEICLVNRYFSFLLKEFEYEAVQRRGSFWWPAGAELPAIYLANRLIPYWHMQTMDRG